MILNNNSTHDKDYVIKDVSIIYDIDKAPARRAGRMPEICVAIPFTRDLIASARMQDHSGIEWEASFRQTNAG